MLLKNSKFLIIFLLAQLYLIIIKSCYCKSLYKLYNKFYYIDYYYKDEIYNDCKTL